MYIDPARVPLTLFRGWCLTAAGAYSVVWVAGSVPWLVGSPPAGMWGHLGLRSGLCWRAWLVLYLFMPWGCGDDMTCANFFSRFLASIRCFFGGLGERVAAVCPAKGGVYSVHTAVRVMPLPVGGAFGAHFC